MDEELEDTEVDTAELDREWHSRREEFWNTGYREGFDEGKLETVQEGFDKGYKFAAGEAFRWGSVKGALLTLEAAMKMDDSSLFEMKDDNKVYQYAALLKDQSTLWKNVYLDVAAKYDEISGIEDVKERKEELSSQSDGGQPLIDGAESVPSKVIEDIEEQLEKSNVPLITSWDKFAGSN